MAEIADIAREAKNIHNVLKESLQRTDPYDREIDFQRKNLRRKYLLLLFVHPYSAESKDAETHLWMQTSYAFIAIYKQRITALDRAQSNARNQQQPQAPANGKPPSGPVEYRKLVQRFRQFLADEDKFWTQLLVRYSRVFALEEAQHTLVALSILSAGIDGRPLDDTEDAPTNNRNHYQFPPLEQSENVIPTTATDRESRIAILSKALICLGDIARYRELYNESGGRPKAGHDDGPAKRGRNRRGTYEGPPRPRNYERAQQCYEKARLLCPHDGNPSHQLAILASYQKDPFSSLIHYYRALCVRQPYGAASENMDTMMHKVLDQWKRKDAAHRDPPPTAVAKIRIDALKEKVIILHGLWRQALEKTDGFSRKLSKGILQEFSLLISERHVPESDILNFVLLVQGAIWRLRILKEPPAAPKGRSESHALPVLSNFFVETRLLAHNISIHRALLEIGLEQVKDIDLREPDLGQRISAVFRRTLPALRIASKWLRANLDYVTQGVEGMKAARTPMEKEPARKRDASITDEVIGIPEFWRVFADFTRELGRAFPLSRLPLRNGPLEEDVDMRGFLPLLNVMEDHPASSTPALSTSAQDQVHPNDVQLMRIEDLLKDAQLIATTQHSPLAVYNRQFVLKGPDGQTSNARLVTRGPVSVANPSLSEVIRNNRLAERDDDDDVMTEGTDDGALREIFELVQQPQQDGGHTDDYDDDDEEVVYMRDPVSPQSPSMVEHNSPKTPVKLPAVPLTQRTPKSNHVAATTAQDLLNNIMQSGNRRDPPGSPTSALFGTKTSMPGHSSIWSASYDEKKSLNLPNAGVQQSPYMKAQNAFTPTTFTPSDWNPSPNRLASNNSQTTISPNGVQPLGQHRSPISSLPPAQLVNESYDTFIGYPSPLLLQQQAHTLPGALGYPRYQYQQQQPLQYASVPANEVYDAQNPIGYHGGHLSYQDPQVGGNRPLVNQLWGNVG